MELERKADNNLRSLAVALWIVGRLNCNVDSASRLLIWVSDVVKSVVAEVNVIVASSTLVFTSLASVARIVLRAGV